MSESFQSRTSIMTTMPTSATRSPIAFRTPDAKEARPRRPTSFVARVTKAPDRRAVVVPELELLEEREHSRAEIGHRARAADLHRVHLDEAEELGDDDEEREADAVHEERAGVLRGGLGDDVRPSASGARGSSPRRE